MTDFLDDSVFDAPLGFRRRVFRVLLGLVAAFFFLLLLSSFGLTFGGALGTDPAGRLAAGADGLVGRLPVVDRVVRRDGVADAPECEWLVPLGFLRRRRKEERTGAAALLDFMLCVRTVRVLRSCGAKIGFSRDWIVFEF